MNKPNPERGWEILNEIADGISDPGTRNYFIATARNLEGAFTSGLISEAAYLKALAGVLISMKDEGE